MLKLSKQHIDKILPQDKLYSLRALKTPAAGKILAKWMVGMGILFLIVLFLPWQQNIRGTGLVTALNPGNRPQTIEAIIAGRIKHWNIREGQFVEKGKIPEKIFQRIADGDNFLGGDVDHGGHDALDRFDDGIAADVGRRRGGGQGPGREERGQRDLGAES